jgi:hypothetical protein
MARFAACSDAAVREQAAVRLGEEKAAIRPEQFE